LNKETVYDFLEVKALEVKAEVELGEVKVLVFLVSRY